VGKIADGKLLEDWLLEVERRPSVDGEVVDAAVVAAEAFRRILEAREVVPALVDELLARVDRAVRSGVRSVADPK
jgi:hypothetical protein